MLFRSRFNAVVSGYDAYANMMKAARRTYSESDMMKTISGSSVPMTPAEIILTVINQGNAFLKGTEVLERTQQIEQQLKKEKDLLSDYVKNETGYDIGNIGNFESKLAAFKIKNKKDN